MSGITKEQANFIQTVGNMAMADMASSSILASLTTAQAILESNWGTSELAQNANAIFGIKADGRWSGRIYSKETKECYDGKNFSDIVAPFRAYGSWKESLVDHSAFLKSGSHYKAVVGEKDYFTACKAIKAAGYATDPEYAEKLIWIIEQYQLTQYDVLTDKEANMRIINSIMTKNPCYTKGRKLVAVKGLMLHSVGTPQPSAQVFIRQWNKESYNNACVHAFIDGNTGEIFQTLPWEHRGWHCASGAKGSGNNTHIGVEMCEPATIKYTGGASWRETGDGTNTKATVLRTYTSAVQLFAFLCEEYHLNPLDDGVIISHSEGYRRGIASNHGDVEHIWKKFGLTMDHFRADVQAAMSDNNAVVTGTATYKVMRGDSLWGIAQKCLGDGNRWPEIKTLNSLESDTIYSGQILKLPTDETAIQATYTVEHGDSLWKIAQKCLGDGNRWPEIKTLNGLDSNVIYSGQVLKLPD
uniref:glucosaminidase domain-containing protein n=1 Tax=Eisenbergiella tayi TaxID=1432052 RepID=UPI003FEE09D0